MALINLLRVWPGPPAKQPVRDLRTAKSAIFVGVGVLNGVSFVSPPYLHHYLCGGGGGAGNAERSFATAVLGVALLFAHMAFSAATVVGSPLLPPVLRWMVWLARVLTGGTFQFGLSVLHFCIQMLLARYTLVSA
ncbi:hypothetical protein SETIT_6G172100v2 [Setaria italica]|uniref:Uncharacterized protein n=1 Tax=Setaria italica TaxID=4555 RepID=A0A368RMP9_SETIT|nr:hypothetical protein SETIT_6G172100v2 [Setaria italica]